MPLLSHSWGHSRRIDPMVNHPPPQCLANYPLGKKIQTTKPGIREKSIYSRVHLQIMTQCFVHG
jgi:hypothetical protein